MSRLNLIRIQELKDLDDDGSNETLKQLINLYYANTEKLINELANEYKSKNWPKVKQLSNSIRASSLNIGADQVVEAARKLEYAEADGIEKIGTEKLITSFGMAKNDLRIYLLT